MKAPFICACLIVNFMVHAVNAGETNVVSLSTANTYVMENAGTVTVSVVRAGFIEGACLVGFRTVQETAFSARDYGAVTGSVEFAGAQTNALLSISLISNTVPDPTRVFQMILENFSYCIPGMVSTGSVFILDAQTAETMPQDFESGLPQGWSIVTNTGENGFWRFNGLAYAINDTGGMGNFVIADSVDFSDPMDTELRLPPFPVSVTALTYLVFRTYYDAGGFDVADVDVNVSGGSGAWTNLWRKSWDILENETGHSWWGPVTELIDLTPVARGQSNVVVRFHYYNATNEWSWQIDDVAILVEPDSNTNGLPDWWETTYYGGLTNLASKGDSDGDGACDENEFIAGTDPRNTGSCFRVEGLVLSNASVSVHFPTAMGHFYDLQSRTNLMSGSWTTRVARIKGLGGDTNISLSAPGSNGFYRLDVQRW